MVTALIIVAAIARLTQLAAGGLADPPPLIACASEGRVGVGRSAGRFQPRAIVAIAVDGNDHH